MSDHRDPATWGRISALLDRLLELPREEREAVLRAETGEDEDLRARVEALLARAEAPSFLEEDAASFTGEAYREAEPSESLAPGGRVGPYRVIERLAVGGMSLVYRVERDDDLERPAVLKVLDSPGLSPEESRRRFGAEQRILASLDHPNIAAVYDGGVLADGRPYLVLEYVPGLTVTEYAAARELSREDRVRLLETVCRAVEHAHRRFVVHRDLKPGNILVRDDGTVKLLDFGIAKILDTGDTDAPVTRTGLRLLTPEYAAPEQVRGGEITAATDVYALGVLLHELLTGERPYDLTGLTPAEMERRVCETDPPRVSTAAGDRGLRGDLDVIVETALRKEPERRYASPGDLADDLARHREGKAIAARSASVAYRTRRTLRRHRILVGVLLLALAFAGFHVVQITAERNLARREAAKAAEVAAFLQELFTLSDPDATRGEPVTARDLLDRAAPRLRTELADQPELRAEMLLTLGEVYSRLSLHEEAREVAAEAHDILAGIHGEGDPASARALSLLGTCELELGHYAAADSLQQAALAARLPRAGKDPAAVAASYQALGVSALNQNRYEEADSLFHAALAIRRTLPAGNEAELGRTLKDLGMVRTALGDSPGGEALLREALAVRREALGDEHSAVYTTLTHLGDNLSLQGRLDEALPLLREGVAGMERILGDAHAEVAEGYNVLGITQSMAGDYDGAVASLERAVTVRRNLHGTEHPDYARGLNDLAAVHLYRLDPGAAEPLLRESLAIHERLLDPDNLVLSVNRTNLARALRDQGKTTEALALYDAAEASYLRQHGEGHPRVAYARVGKAETLFQAGRVDEADSLLRRALGTLRDAYPDGHARVAVGERALGNLLRGTGRPEEALPHLREATTLYVALRGEDSLETAGCRLDLAACLLALDRPADARGPLEAALPVTERALAANHPRQREAWGLAADVYRGTGEVDVADGYEARLRNP